MSKLSRVISFAENMPVISSILFGLLVFGIISFGLQQFFEVYSKCASGWVSPSIGKRGACSHHGGVTTHNGWVRALAFWTGVAGGLWSYSTISSPPPTETPKKQNTSKMPQSKSLKKSESPTFCVPAPKTIPKCPLHGEMYLSSSGQKYVCRAAPNCDYFHHREAN